MGGREVNAQGGRGPPDPPRAYGLKPWAGSSHAWALAQVAALPPGPLRVLDVGAGPGHVARAVRDARAGRGDVELWAVEPAGPGPDGAADRWVARVEDVTARGFDLALALDVLEHSSDPARLLAEVVARVRPAGVVLVSVPNAVHWSVRAAVLAGRFEYADRGILDRGHRYFFTRRSIVRMAREAGLVVEETSESIVPLELVAPRRLTSLGAWTALTSVRRALAHAWPGVLAYQVLLRARRP